MAANIIIFLFGMANVYYLALTYIGVYPSYKQTILPILTYAILSYISKVVFQSSAATHTVLLVIFGAILLIFFNRVGIMLSLIGILSSMVTTMAWSLMILCPLWLKLGIDIPFKTEGLRWIFFNVLEVSVPFIVLVVLRKKKLSMSKFILQ